MNGICESPDCVNRRGVKTLRDLSKLSKNELVPQITERGEQINICLDCKIELMKGKHQKGRNGF